MTTAGGLFLESLRSGVITQTEIDWLLSQHGPVREHL
jgi:hypothetical protein